MHAALDRDDQYYEQIPGPDPWDIGPHDSPRRELAVDICHNMGVV